MTYQQAVKLARKIYKKTHGRPKSHHGWANSFNIIGDIAKKSK